MQDGEEAARVLAEPGPTFTVERYTKPTCEGGTWEPAGEPRPLTLDGAGSGTYVDLPVR